MLVYFAHPIDQAGSPDAGSAARFRIRAALVEAGLSVYMPSRAFRLANPTMADLASVGFINNAAVMEADALVAWLPSGVATLGVPAEIEQALQLNRPILILTDGDLILRSVQLVTWRNRGATILTWNDRMEDAWKRDPGILRGLLSPADKKQTPPPVGLLEGSDLRIALNPAAKEPTRAYSDDAGLDLAILNEERLFAGEYRMLPTGVRAAVPSGWWGMITGRSSTWAKHKCDVRLAVIDAGYRGELMIGVENRSGRSIVFEAGVRLAQYVLIPTFPGRTVVVDRLPEAHRGEAGYGSSGA